MTFKTFAAASLFALFSFGAVQAAQAGTLPADQSSVMQYHYGDHLDVKKVLSIKDDKSNACGLVTTRMNYLDSQGQAQSVQYRTYATAGCHDN